MAKFHVNPETGEPGECKAKVACRFGDLPHFDSLEEAAQEADFTLASEYETKSLKKPGAEVPREAVVDLIKELYTAAEAYYHKEEESSLSDEEFDSKLEYLQELYEAGVHKSVFSDHPEGVKLLESDPSLGTKAEEATVEHSIPMLSLAKAKKEPDLLSFLRKARAAGATDFRLQAKLDGLAMAVRYENGAIVRIATRGDGTHGEDVTYLIQDPNVKIKGLELTVSEQEPFEVRGELFFTNEQFEQVDEARFKATGVRFKNSRNSASGLMKAAKQGVTYPVEFTFAAYSVIKGDEPAGLEEVKRLGFRSVDELTEDATPGLTLTGFASDADVMDAVNKFGETREGFHFPTDGVVIKPVNEAAMLKAMGSTSHHPASQVAWKYPDATAATEVLAIDITVGSSGKVTPIARVKPVDLDGSTIQNASLHNFNLIKTKGIRVGSVVLVEKANSIIPQVKLVISNPQDSVEVTTPTACPSCGTKLAFDEGEKEWPPKTMRCPNSNCESRMFFSLKMAVGKNFMDIDGLSEVSLDYLHDIGRVKTIADLYTLKLPELADSQLGESQQGNARRLGEKRAQNILDHIEKSKTRPLSKMLPAISIESLGPSTAKALEKRFGDIDGILEAPKEAIAAIPGLGEITANKIHQGLIERRPIIDAMRSHGVTFGKGVQKAATAGTAGGSNLSGKSFAISGAVPPGFRNRGEWVDFVEANGGEFHSSPKAHTTYMIGDPSESSSKVKAALKHGLTFLSPEGFSSQFN